MKISVCLDAVYAGTDTVSAMERAHALGAAAVEFWSWKDKDLDGIAKAGKTLGLPVAAICTSEFRLTDKDCRQAFADGVRESVRAAQKLGCNMLITQSGDLLTDVPREAQADSIVEGLRAVRGLLADEGMTLVIEPLNTKYDHTTCFLSGSDECAELLARVDSPAVGMLYDVYHQQITEGDILRTVGRHFGRIRHMHCAGVPGRGPLTGGELDYPAIFRAIDAMGYAGYMGLELFATEPDAAVRPWTKQS